MSNNFPEYVFNASQADAESAAKKRARAADAADRDLQDQLEREQQAVEIGIDHGKYGSHVDASPAPAVVGVMPTGLPEVKITNPNPRSIEDVVVALRDSNLPQNRFVFNFGPFAGLEQRVLNTFDDFKGANPEVNAHFRDASRESLHQAFAGNPLAAENGEVGLAVRITALGNAKEIYATRFADAAELIGPGEMGPYLAHKQFFDQGVSAEIRRIEYALSHASPPGLGRLVLAGLGGLTAAIRGDYKVAASDTERDWRNDHVEQRLNELDGLSKELSKHVGNETWEEGRGVELMKRAATSFAEIEESIDGAKGREDRRALRSRFDSIKNSFDEAASKAKLDQLRESIRSFCQSIQRFVQRIRAVLGFGSVSAADAGSAAAIAEGDVPVPAKSRSSVDCEVGKNAESAADVDLNKASFSAEDVDHSPAQRKPRGMR